MKIGIIGGHGAMGSFISGVFRRAGHEVTVSDLGTSVTNLEIAESSDIVVVSVPIRVTVKVILEIAPYMREEQILCDLTSIKSEPVTAMLTSEAQVVGLHPMFGPSLPSLLNQTIVVSPARIDESALQNLLSIFENEGAEIAFRTPEEHDRLMAVVQGLTHFSSLTLAEAMRGLGMNPCRMAEVTSPVYRIEMGLIGRILGQDAGLYGDILQKNPCVPEALRAFSEAAADLAAIVEGGDEEAFEAFFSLNRETFEGYIPQATADTDAMIKRLVMR